MYYLTIKFADGSRSEELCSVAVSDGGHLIASPKDSGAQPRIIDAGAVVGIGLVRRGMPKKEEAE